MSRNIVSLPLLAGLLTAVMLFSGPATADSKKDALIKAMNDHGCQMTTAQANKTMPALGISRPEAIRISREMMGEGIAKFASDEETLLLLPPACKS